MDEFVKWLPVIINVFVAGIIYGGLTVRVNNVEKVVERHDKAIGIHDRKLANIEGRRAAAAEAGGHD